MPTVRRHRPVVLAASSHEAGVWADSQGLRRTDLLVVSPYSSPDVFHGMISTGTLVRVVELPGWQAAAARRPAMLRRRHSVEQGIAQLLASSPGSTRERVQ